MVNKAILVLADGSIFHGVSIGAQGKTGGEVVFNTSMTGYQEILTDTSYAGQIITLTYPHIGNTGVNEEDVEAHTIYSAGLIVKDVPDTMSSWRAEQTLPDYLRAKNIVAISGIDTRKLTRLLREKGAQNGCIIAGDFQQESDVAAAITEAKEHLQSLPSMKGQDLAITVTTDKSYQWTDGIWDLDNGYSKDASAVALSQGKKRKKVAAYDFGIKHNILRLLVESGCEVTVYPAKTPAAEILAADYDGVFLSNGPGDPEPCDYAIENIKQLLAQSKPIFGICLGHQLLSLAVGAKTVKMKFGHHGANHPVKDVLLNKVVITSQNHGFAVDESSLPDNVEVTHFSLFDKSNQGIRLKDKPAFSFQGHPEASPGPQDIQYLFDQFVELMNQ